MTGCQTCGGYGMRHDPIAHGKEERQVDSTHAETLDRAVRLLAWARRMADHCADPMAHPIDWQTWEKLADEIAALIGHSVTDQPESPEMFALREFIGESDCSGCSMPGGRHWDTCPNRWDERPSR